MFVKTFKTQSVTGKEEEGFWLIDGNALLYIAEPVNL